MTALRAIRIAGCLAGVAACLIASARASSGDPGGAVRPPFDSIAFDQRLGEALPLDLRLRGEAGDEAPLASHLAPGRPVILSMAYFRCPMLCPLVQNGLASSLEVLGLTAGRDFVALTVSIDPRETAEQASASKARTLQGRRIPGAREGWRFLTGSQDQVSRLAASVGFNYVYDETIDQFAHGSGVVLITPEGRISRYFLGLDFAPKDLRLALVEASGGRVGSLADRLTLLCYQYDPTTGHYGFVTYALVRTGGVLTVLALTGFIVVMMRRERRSASGRPA